jgi:hypothetical protein
VAQREDLGVFGGRQQTPAAHGCAFEVVIGPGLQQCLRVSDDLMSFPHTLRLQDHRIKGEFWNPQGSTVLRDVDDHVGAGFELADRGRAGEPVGVFRAACRRIVRDEHGHPRKG